MERSKTLPTCLYSSLEQSYRTYPKAIAVSQCNEKISYQMLKAKVDALATLLLERGVQKGDRVSIFLPKGIDAIVSLYAISRIGAVFVPIPPQHRPRQIAYLLKDSGSRHVLCNGVGQSLLKKCQHLGLHFDTIDPNTDLRSSVLPPPNTTPDALAALMYTSGSTGGPKGVMLSHKNLLLGAQSCTQYLKITAEDRLLGVLPLGFDYGLNQLITTVLVGAQYVVQKLMFPSDMSRSLMENKITGLAGIPTVWTPLMEYLEANPMPLDCLRYVCNSGGALPHSTLRRMQAHFKKTDIFLMYGLTEGFRATYLKPELLKTKPGAIGNAVPNAKIYVVHPLRGKCGPGEEGELIQGGELLSQGYWQNPKATEKSFRVNPHLIQETKNTKLLHSGDQVRIDEEGVLWYVGRMDEMIKSNGVRISPTEIEQVILDSKQVKEAFVFGQAHAVLGQSVAAAISFKSDGSLERLKTFLKTELPPIMVPKRFHLWEDPMPTTPTGKLDRKRILSKYQGETNARQPDRSHFRSPQRQL